jgi:hypothetical protein
VAVQAGGVKVWLARDESEGWRTLPFDNRTADPQV